MKSHPFHVSSNTSLPLAIRDTFPSWISYAHMKVCISILPLKKTLMAHAQKHTNYQLLPL